MVTLPTPSHAIVRPPSPAYASCLRERPVVIDVDLAVAQHEAYVAALRDAGVTVVMLPALRNAPDGVFVEDTAVVLDTVALVTRPGAPTRRCEVDSTAAALAGRRTVHRMDAPATLDGGDVLRIGGTLVVGLSQRTNREGLARLAEVAAMDGLHVRGVDVGAGLHLKSACTLGGAELLLLHEGAIDRGALRGLPVEIAEVPEAEGANVLAFADRVIVSAAAVRTREALERRGLRTVAVALSEIHAGDGALTCLSLRIGATHGPVA